ncbi:VOC family protein [Candidatus Marimicrobium litorale]|uniref:VOC family protein n=1 Tax=Candidatus Marimicrobium litorale TaxID=2518991 RepID=A0ABT3T262_9GAMM|nr:VOC family protein [Candidatus Marimicrobium litorale]MCX2976204.1 VOC family protein [Candidatus Marimicrobium litorale]
MIAYTTIGTANIESAKAFYLELLAELKANIVMDTGRLAVIGTPAGGGMLAVCTPYDEGEPNPGNGNMIAITPGSTELVDQLYNKAIALGAADEGEPGERMEGFYGAYCRDADGNKVCFCHFG